MFFSSRNGDDMGKRYPGNNFFLKNNMWGVCVKTSTFLYLSFLASCFLLFAGFKVATCQEGQPLKIAIIGDSLTQGYGLRTADNLVSQLQRRLSEDNYNVELLNMGVSGDTTAGGLERFEWSISSGVVGVVIILGGNDLLRGIPPSESFQNIRSMIIKAEDRGLPVLLVGMKAPGNFGSTYKKDFDLIYFQLHAEFDTFYYENFFGSLNQGNVSIFLTYMQDDGIHPNSHGIQRIVNDMYPTFGIFLNSIEGSQ